MGLTDTAYHEAGHAVADFVFGVTIIRVSIVPDEGSLGHVRHKPPFQRDDVTEAELAPRTLRRLENRIVAFCPLYDDCIKIAFALNTRDARKGAASSRVIEMDAEYLG